MKLRKLSLYFSLAIIHLLVWQGFALAQSTRSQAISNLMQEGVPAEQAVEIAGLATGNGVLPNNTYELWRNAAGTANLSVIKSDGSDNTVINTGSGKTIKLSYNGTANLNANSGDWSFVSTNHVIHASGNTGSIVIGGGQTATTTDGGTLSLSGLTSGTGNASLSSSVANGSGVKLNIGAADNLGDVTVRDSNNATNRVVFPQSGGIDVTSTASKGVLQRGATGLTAAGTTQGTCLALTAIWNNVTTAAASTGVCLPNLAAANGGPIVYVRNGGANALKVYPATGSGTINGGAGGAGVTISNTGSHIAICTAIAGADTWSCADAASAT